MTSSTSGPIELRAGWYADPDVPTGERWWNGSQWTSHTREAEPVEAEPFEAVTTAEGRAPMAWSTASGPLATLPPIDSARATHVSARDGVIPAAPPVPPGWYPDPHGAPAQRWWDGTAWSAHTAPLPGYPAYGGTTVVTVAQPKSVGVALLLTFFFGPLGMLYSTVSGALIMLGISFFGGLVVGIATLGLAWVVWGPAVWLTSMIWGCVAASNQQGTQVITAYR
jgi:hypothetical protein